MNNWAKKEKQFKEQAISHKLAPTKSCALPDALKMGLIAPVLSF